MNEYTENDANRDDAARDRYDSEDAQRARECEEAAASLAPESCFMSERAEHTPGPWTKETTGRRVFISGRYYHDGGSYVAEVSLSAEVQSTIERRCADARLITAAPELLAALAAIIDSAEDGRPVPEWLSERLIAARAAIAKTKSSVVCSHPPEALSFEEIGDIVKVRCGNCGHVWREAK